MDAIDSPQPKTHSQRLLGRRKLETESLEVGATLHLDLTTAARAPQARDEARREWNQLCVEV